MSIPLLTVLIIFISMVSGVDKLNERVSKKAGRNTGRAEGRKKRKKGRKEKENYL